MLPNLFNKIRLVKSKEQQNLNRSSLNPKLVNNVEKKEFPKNRIKIQDINKEIQQKFEKNSSPIIIPESQYVFDLKKTIVRNHELDSVPKKLNDIDFKIAKNSNQLKSNSFHHQNVPLSKKKKNNSSNN